MLAATASAQAAPESSFRCFPATVNSPVRPLKAAPSVAPSRANDLITSPEGAVTVYSRSSFGVAPFGDMAMETDDYGFAGIFVQAEGSDKVYIKNPFSQFVTNTYLEGTMADGVISIELPQHVYTIDDDEFGIVDLYAQRLIFNEDGDALIPDPDSSTFTLVLEDGRWLQDDDALLAMTFDDDAWTGYADYMLAYAPVTAQEATLPEGLEMQKCSLICGSSGYNVDVAITADKAYIADILDAGLAPIVGDVLSDGSLSFPSNQYLGVNEESSYLAYFYGGDLVEHYDAEVNRYFDVFELQEALVLVPNDDKSVYTGSNDALLTPFTQEELGNEFFWEMATFKNPELRMHQASDFHPMAPKFDAYFYYDSFGFGYVSIDIPALNRQGDLIDADNMYYNIYINGDLFTFASDWYQLLDNEYTDVPYNFTDAADNQGDIKVEGSMHTIMLFFAGIETIGIQSYYQAEGSDERMYSYLVTYDTATGQSTTGIANVAASDAIGTEYYNLQGIRIDRPQGLYIEAVKHSDGSVSSALRRK